MKYKTITIIIVLIAAATLGVYYLFKSESITNYPSKGTDIVAFGDSLVAGYGSTEGNNFVSVLSKKIGEPIINLGHSGDTTEDGLKRINQLDKYNPKVVILLLGGNDSLRKVPIEITHKNLSTLIENIQARGAVVLLLGVKGSLFGDRLSSEFKDLRDTYNTAFVSNVLDGLFGNDKYMSDTIHPNDAGYEIIANRIHPILVGLIK